MMKSSRIRAALRSQAKMMREILANVRMNAKELAAFKKAMFVLVPLPQ